MSVTKLLASDFNSEQVAIFFNVDPARHAVRAAMTFMYRIHKEEAAIVAKDIRSRAKEIAEVTCEKMDFDYCLFNDFHENFSKEKTFDHEAVAIAVICREDVERINRPRRMRDGEIRENNDSIDPDLALRAQRIRQQACKLIHKEILPQDCSEEAVFVAHVLPFKNFSDHEIEFEENPYADHSKTTELISAVRQYLRGKTDIGKTLNGIMDGIEQALSAQAARTKILPPPPHETFNFMSQSGIEKVFAHFSLSHDQQDERVSMAFVYDRILEEMDAKMDGDIRRSIAADKTIESLESVHRALKNYGENFFQDETMFDPRALMYALYCGKHLEKANDEIEQTPEERNRNAPPRFYGEDFDEISLQNAIGMVEEAECISNGVWPYPNKKPFTESFYLAHENGIRAIFEFNKNFSIHSMDEIVQFTETVLRPARNFAQPHKEMGQELLTLIDLTEAKINTLKTREPEPEAPKRPVLRVVTSEFRGFE